MKRFEAFLAMARSMHRDLSLPMGKAYSLALAEVDENLSISMAGKYPEPFKDDDRVPEFLIQVFRAMKEAA